MGKKIDWAPAPPMVGWNKLKALRKQRGFTQPQLAVGAGLSVAVVWQIEHGLEARTTVETKTKLAKFFDCAIDDLFPVEWIGNQPREEFLRQAGLRKTPKNTK